MGIYRSKTLFCIFFPKILSNFLKKIIMSEKRKVATGIFIPAPFMTKQNEIFWVSFS